MSKVGIMSMQRIVNYGSFLQAYGLKKTIESLGNEVEFIDYIYEKSLISSKKRKFTFNKIFNNINIYYYIKKKKHSKKFKKLYNNYLESINITEKNYNTNIDSLVIGSDEVFNCLQSFPVGYSRGLFGKGYEHTNIISYAASFGYTTIDGLKKYKIDEEISQMLKKFRTLSVRDKNSKDIISTLCKKEPIIHLDPVLISDYSNELIKVDLHDYIIIYAYTGRLSKVEEKCIKKFAKKYGKKIVSIGFYQKIADLNLIVHPFEVLSYFKNADYVITDTFHGTIFSIKMNTKFCTLIRESNKNKLSYLLNILKQENRVANSLDDVEILYKTDVDFSITNEIIELEKNRTLDYLKNNL